MCLAWRGLRVFWKLFPLDRASAPRSILAVEQWCIWRDLEFLKRRYFYGMPYALDEISVHVTASGECPTIHLEEYTWNVLLYNTRAAAYFLLLLLLKWAGIAQSLWCLTTDWTTGVRSPAETKKNSSNLSVQTSSEAHTASCTMDTGWPFAGGKERSGSDADDSSHAVLKSRISTSYIPSPLWLLNGGTALYFPLFYYY
jgi:hypothetical protein